MIKYVGKRIMLLIPILFCIIFIVFLIMALMPGDPGRMQLGIGATKEAVDIFNGQFGLDRPFFLRFFRYIGGIVTRFDFGISYRSRDAVMQSIIGCAPVTVITAAFGVAGALLIGVPLGVLAAIRRGSLTDASVTVFALFLSAIPSYWFGLMLLYLFSIVLSILPTHGVQTWRGFVLPVASLAVPGASGFIRLTRVTMLDVVHQEYIRTARAKGAPEYSVIWKHAFRNAAMPLVNGAGMMFGALLGGTVIIESVFSLPGLGRMLVMGISQRDTPVVMGCTIFISVVFMVIILLIDIIYAALDPRVRKRFTTGGGIDGQ
jgi:peptide/nickel transport system permease protein